MSENLSIVRKFLDLVGETEANRIVDHNKIDFSTLKSLLTSDFVIRNPIFHPDHGIIKDVGESSDGSLIGPDAMEEDIKATASYFSFSVKDSKYYDAGDVIIFQGTINVRGLKTGELVETPFAELFYIRDGLIYLIEPYLNTNAVRQVI